MSQSPPPPPPPAPEPPVTKSPAPAVPTPPDPAPVNDAKPQRGLMGLTSLGLFGMNILGLLILWPLVCFTNWYLVGFFEDNLDGELSALADAMVGMPWWVVSLGIVATCIVLTILQVAIKEHGKTTTINIVVGLIVLVYLILWIVGIGAGLVDVWAEANAMPDPLPPIYSDPPPADVPDPIRPFE